MIAGKSAAAEFDGTATVHERYRAFRLDTTWANGAPILIRADVNAFSLRWTPGYLVPDNGGGD